MRKIKRTILSILSVGAVVFTGAAALCAQNSPLIASAAKRNAPPVTELISPLAYEEYLQLETPLDVALTGNYTAISDADTVYLFNRAENRYYEYAHGKKVTKLQFDGNEILYFLDEDMMLHTLDPQKLTDGEPCATSLSFACTTFLIQGNDLYYTAEAGGKAKINKTTLTELGETNILLVENVTPGPTLAYYGDKLYYTSGNLLYFYEEQYNNDKKGKYVATFHHVPKVASMSIVNDCIFLCAEREETGVDVQNLFAYSLSEITQTSNPDNATPLPTDTVGGYTALASHGDYVYAVQKNRVRQYDVAKQAFTDYEICSRSNSVHRLDTPSESCFIGDKLLIADDGNARITVYDTKTGVYQTPISSEISAAYLVSDGETVLAADSEQAILYNLTADNYGEILATFDDFDNQIVGAAAVYGKYYFVTSDYRYVAENTEDGWTLSQPHQANVTATLLTTDAYGYLYVAGGGCVYKYTEEQFFEDETRDKVCEDFPTGASKLLVDYAGNLYALLNGELQKIGGETYALNTSLVYNPTATVQSFAFGIEDNITYVVYEQNYLAKTTLLDLPTVKNIAVDGADESVFAKESAVFEVMEVQPNTLVIRFDINALSGAELFPYQSYERRKDAFVALKIGETSPYNLLAVYDESAQEYFTCIALADFCKPAEAYCTTYENSKNGWLTNAVSLYKFPYLTDLLTVTRLTSGAKVTVLGEIEKLDYAYYHVQITDENGETQTGYIPRVYLTEFDGAPPKPHTQTTQNKTDGEDLLWRFTYITLGVGVICILVDVLILKKPKKEENEEAESTEL